MWNKIAGLFIASVLGAFGVWAVVKYGPRPEADKKRLEQPAAATPEANNANITVPASDSEAANFLNILGRSVAKGESDKPVEAFVSELRQKYEDRGFRSFESVLKNAGPGAGGAGIKTGIYSIACQEDTCFVSAPDTPSAETGRRTFQHITVVERKKGKTIWEEFRLGGDPGDIENADAAGEDPPLIPRVEGSRRIFSISQGNKYTAIYESGRPLNEISDWYLSKMADLEFERVEMPPGNGLLCFVRKNTFCMIWLSHDTENKNTSILVSLQT